MGLAIDPAGRNAHAANEVADGTVTQFRLADGVLSPRTPAAVAAGSYPSGVAVGLDGERAYVTNSGFTPTSTVSQYSIAPGGGLSPLQAPEAVTGTTPIAIALSPDGDSAYVPNLYSASISQFTATSPTTAACGPRAPLMVPAGVQPQGIVFTDDGSRAYVVNYGSSNISSYSVDGGGRLRALGPPPTPTGEQSEAIALRSTSPGAADRHGLRIVGLQRNPERGTARADRPDP